MTKKSRKDKNFIKMPQYPGGNEALRKFIDSQFCAILNRHLKK